MEPSEPPSIQDVQASYRSAHFGERLRRLRHARCLDIESLSRASGIAAVTLAELEQLADIPGIRLLERLCLALQAPLSTLLQD